MLPWNWKDNNNRQKKSKVQQLVNDSYKKLSTETCIVR